MKKTQLLPLALILGMVGILGFALLAPAPSARAQVVIYHPWFRPYVYRPVVVAPVYRPIYRPYGVYRPYAVYRPWAYRPGVYRRW